MKSQQTRQGPFDAEEYSSFRWELLTITQARYAILGFEITAFGVLTAFALSGNAEVSSSSFRLKLWLPCLYAFILVPGVLMTFFLNLHYRRIDAYIWARFERGREGQLFQRAYNWFRERTRLRSAYASPLMWTYASLLIFAALISVLANSKSIISSTDWTSIIYRTPELRVLGGGVLALLVLGLVVAWPLNWYAFRKLTDRYRKQWEHSLELAETQETPRRGNVAVFLDRDGVINENRPDGVTSVRQFKPITHALEALAKLQREKLAVIVVTNQPYVGNGQMTTEDLDEINRHMQEQVYKKGGWITKIYSCTHPEEADCACRKPKTALFWKAFRELGIDPRKSWLVGDQLSDIEAGKQLGMLTILVLTGEGTNAKALLSKAGAEQQPDAVRRDLREAVDLIVQKNSERLNSERA